MQLEIKSGWLSSGPSNFLALWRFFWFKSIGRVKSSRYVYMHPHAPDWEKDCNVSLSQVKTVLARCQWMHSTAFKSCLTPESNEQAWPDQLWKDIANWRLEWEDLIIPFITIISWMMDQKMESYVYNNSIFVLFKMNVKRIDIISNYLNDKLIY